MYVKSYSMLNEFRFMGSSVHSHMQVVSATIVARVCDLCMF